jgi:hypothetical protein
MVLISAFLVSVGQRQSGVIYIDTTSHPIKEMVWTGAPGGTGTVTGISRGRGIPEIRGAEMHRASIVTTPAVPARSGLPGRRGVRTRSGKMNVMRRMIDKPAINCRITGTTVIYP